MQVRSLLNPVLRGDGMGTEEEKERKAVAEFPWERGRTKKNKI